MKTLLIIVFLSISFYLDSNPITEVFTYIPVSEPIKPYEKIWKAVCTVESQNYNLAYNSKERATGIAQIRPICLKDYNNRTGKNYDLSDCFKVSVSKEIFMYYAQKYNPDEHEKIAKNWNKSKTDKYWNKVKHHC